MRVLFATDGSKSADRARDLLAALPWPDGTQFCVGCAVTSRGELFATPWPVPYTGDLGALDEEARRHAQVTLDDAERTLGGVGRTVDRITFTGRPATAIIEEARSWHADLIVLGSRGHGPFVTMLLGSVSAEVVDHAPCPVMVVRRDRVNGLVFAEDGSPCAAHAANVIRSWPVLHDVPLEVVSVAEIGIPWSAGMPAGLYDEVMESYVEDVAAARTATEAVARKSADEFTAAGFRATPRMLEGDPAHTIVEFAHGRPDALLVMGTRGHGGLARALLGSVARNVLLHAPNSVLIVRETAAAEHSEEHRKPVGTSA
jgi:nucleotide-binding universal stress UspA family protein